MSAISSYLGAKTQAKATEKQADVQEKVSQWGYGYPDWLLGGMEDLYTDAKGWSGAESEIQSYIDALKAEAPVTKETLGTYAGSLEMPTGESPVAMQYAKFLRGAEEGLSPGGMSFTAGKGGGFSERSLRETALETSTAENQFQLQAQQQRNAVRAEQLAANLQALGVDSTTAKSIADATATKFTQKNTVLKDTLGMITGIPSLSYTANTPGVSPALAAMTALAKTTGQAGGSYAYQQGMNNALGSTTSPYGAVSNQAYSNYQSPYAMGAGTTNDYTAWNAY